MGEIKAAYTAGPDPFEALKNYLQPAEAARLVNQLRAVWGLGRGWGKVTLTFKRFKLCRPVTEISAEEEGD